MNIETKNAALEIKAISEDGTFEGYGSIFGNVDSDYDIISRGAFSQTLADYKASGKLPKLLWQHDPRQPIGVWEEMREDEKGLFVKGRLIADVQKGKEAMALMRSKAIDEMSVGFTVGQYEYEGEDGMIRRINSVKKLYEVSLVTWAANDRAVVTDVKAIKTVRNFEQFLRDAGYSAKDAKTITAYGFKSFVSQRDVVDESAELEALKQSINKLRGNIHE